MSLTELNHGGNWIFFEVPFSRSTVKYRLRVRMTRVLSECCFLTFERLHESCPKLDV